MISSLHLDAWCFISAHSPSCSISSKVMDPNKETRELLSTFSGEKEKKTPACCLSPCFPKREKGKGGLEEKWRWVKLIFLLGRWVRGVNWTNVLVQYYIAAGQGENDGVGDEKYEMKEEKVDGCVSEDEINCCNFFTRKFFIFMKFFNVKWNAGGIALLSFWLSLTSEVKVGKGRKEESYRECYIH